MFCFSIIRIMKQILFKAHVLLFNHPITNMQMLVNPFPVVSINIFTNKQGRILNNADA